jgi:hypothetical protein
MSLRISEDAVELEGYESVQPIQYIQHIQWTQHRHDLHPTPTEMILRAVEMSDAEEEATRFVRHIQELQGILATTNSIEGYDATHERIKECHEVAKVRFGFYERLADLWRGAEFNLHSFLNGSARQREQLLETARQEHERLEAQRATEAERLRIEREAPPAPPAPPTLPTSISELLTRLTNEAQKQALQRLLYRDESNQVYLSAYQSNPTRLGRTGDVEGTFTILGTIRHGTRESYTVKWYRLTSTKPSFWCNCPDHKFNSNKKNMVCKHICFLVTRVGRILDPAFFEGKRLTAEQHTQLLEIVGNAAMFQNVPIVPVTPRETQRDVFMECRKPVEADDSCPICYDSMIETACLNCPTCSNNVHRDCMEVWLERNRTCVYCRSTVWSAWN